MTSYYSPWLSWALRCGSRGPSFRSTFSSPPILWQCHVFRRREFVEPKGRSFWSERGRTGHCIRSTRAGRVCMLFTFPTEIQGLVNRYGADCRQCSRCLSPKTRNKLTQASRSQQPRFSFGAHCPAETHAMPRRHRSWVTPHLWRSTRQWKRKGSCGYERGQDKDKVQVD